jgi:hypothetical protein
MIENKYKFSFVNEQGMGDFSIVNIIAPYTPKYLHQQKK